MGEDFDRDDTDEDTVILPSPPPSQGPSQLLDRQETPEFPPLERRNADAHLLAVEPPDTTPVMRRMGGR